MAYMNLEKHKCWIEALSDTDWRTKITGELKRKVEEARLKAYQDKNSPARADWDWVEDYFDNLNWNHVTNIEKNPQFEDYGILFDITEDATDEEIWGYANYINTVYHCRNKWVYW